MEMELELADVTTLNTIVDHVCHVRLPRTIGVAGIVHVWLDGTVPPSAEGDGPTHVSS